MEIEDHKYVGDGYWRYELKSIELSPGQKTSMRISGVTMVIMGLLFMSFPAIFMIYPLLLGIF